MATYKFNDTLERAVVYYSNEIKDEMKFYTIVELGTIEILLQLDNNYLKYTLENLIKPLNFFIRYGYKVGTEKGDPYYVLITDY